MIKNCVVEFYILDRLSVMASFLWLVGERGLSEDGEETLYILSNHADSRERIEKELIWRFEHAIYVYEALAEKVLKDERKDRGELK